MTAASLLAACFVAPVVGAADEHVPEASSRRTFASVRDCEVGYRVYAAAGAHVRQAPAVILAHGFMRSGEFMRGWAEAIAAGGVTAVTTDLCASTALDGRHADNGSDLVALRGLLGFSDVVYVGVSAGGLAALFAAAQDQVATRGLLLLDPTNAGGQARAAASRVRAPVAALVARPQVCNAWRNIDGALHTLADATIVPTGRASHCDFEWPSDRFCRVACLAVNADPPAIAQARIRTIALGFIAAIASGDDRTLERWKAGIGHAIEHAAPPLDGDADSDAAPAPIR